MEDKGNRKEQVDEVVQAAVELRARSEEAQISPGRSKRTRKPS